MNTKLAVSVTRLPVLVSLFAVAIAFLALLVAAPAAFTSHLDEPPDPDEPIGDPIPGHIEDGDIQLELETLAEGRGLTAPNWGTYAPGQPNTLYVVDQDGPLWAIDTRTGRKTVALNTRPLLVPLVPGDERGFLGVAFDPDFGTNGKLYTYTSERIPNNPDGSPAVQPNHRSVIREWVVPAANRVPAPRNRPNNNDNARGTFGLAPDATREVTSFVQPQFNHNGGAIFFGTRPDERDLLYVTSGDGGCADDQNMQLGLGEEGPCIGHGPGSEATAPNRAGNGQSLDTPLGKILRLDPTGTYPEAALPETIYAYGFRNPFRASSDRTDLGGTGEIWTADVGQNYIEEVDGRVQQGGNYGWHFKEGQWLFNPFFYDLQGFASDSFVYGFSPGQPADMIDPNAEYDHDEGVAIIGGFVYRGQRIEELRGRYVFGDYSDGFNSANGRVMYLDEDDNADIHERTPKIFNLINGHTNLFVNGFGEDAAGELYVLANKTGIPFEETGVVMKLVERCAPNRDCRD